MGMVIDHLRADQHVRVSHDFIDARGRRIRSGVRGVLRRLDLDWPRQEIVLVWERDGGAREELRFALRATEGPRNGAMREFFDLEEPAPDPSAAAGASSAESLRPVRELAVPTLTPDLVTDPTQREPALQRLWALAHARRFDEAHEQLRVLAQATRREGELELLAGDVAELAAVYRVSRDQLPYCWLRERALDLWYAWGSQATAGGEGAVRGRRIREIEARLPKPA